MHKRLGFCSVVWTHLTVFSLITLLQLSPLRADLVLVGNTDPIPVLVSDAAGDIGGDLTIGVTGVGGLFMDVAPPLSGNLMHLISDNGIIGDGINSIGAAVFDDFGVVWEVDQDLTIGNAGQGFLDVFESASIEVDGGPSGSGATFVGREVTGQGVVRLNGLASRLTTSDLTIGDLGVGTVEANLGASLVSRRSIIGNRNGSTGVVTLTDLGTRWDLRGPLTIGNGNAGAVSAHGFLNINSQALLQSNPVASVTINETGQVIISGGMLRQIIGGPAISNSGLIRGDGFIEADLDINADGELRNAAATADEREYLLISGIVNNMGGYIESFGGEMEFLDTVTNGAGGELVARDAIMRFLPGGLVNDGDLILGGDTIVHGTISGAGMLTVLNNSVITVVGDVTFTESPLVAALGEGGDLASIHSPSSSAISFTVGDNPGTLNVIGEVTLGSGTVLELDFSSSVSSQPGDSFQVLSANNVVGSFANDQAIANGRYWDISYDGDEIFVTASYQLVTTGLGDFDTDGDVDGFDFLTWQRGSGTIFDANDLADWEANYGNLPPVAATAAVPEPSALVLALAALAFGYRRRVA